MTQPQIPAHLRSYVLDMAALNGQLVCQGHADVCKILGHGHNVKNGVEQGWCPRCGTWTVVSCDWCEGTGKSIQSGYPCIQCNGSQVIPITDTLTTRYESRTDRFWVYNLTTHCDEQSFPSFATFAEARAACGSRFESSNDLSDTEWNS